MEDQLSSQSALLPTGGLLRLQARATDLLTWIGPTWAVLCGVAASGGFVPQRPEWLKLALLILLVDGGWGSLWSALGATDWATPFSRWGEWRENTPTRSLPYTLPDAPGGRISRRIGELRAWWSQILWPSCGSALRVISVALPASAILTMFFGPQAILLSVAALALMQLGVIWEGGRGIVSPGWDAALAVTLPWLAGHVTFSPVSLRSAALAGLFALAWGKAWKVTSGWARALTVGSQLLIMAFLVVIRQPLAAGVLFLVLVPQLALLPWIRRGRTPEWYVRHTRLWLMAAMAVAALAV